MDGHGKLQLPDIERVAVGSTIEGSFAQGIVKGVAVYTRGSLKIEGDFLEVADLSIPEVGVFSGLTMMVQMFSHSGTQSRLFCLCDRSEKKMK